MPGAERAGFGQPFPAADQRWPVMAMINTEPPINPAFGAQEGRAPTSQPAPSERVPAWEMPAVTVVGQAESKFREDDRIGTYQQPRWTADRRFPGVRTYVIPENSVEFEYWTRVDVARHGPSEVQHMFELEFGLPYRLQLDLYAIARSEGSGGETFFDQQIELRYAFADYGKIWGNPALYLEYAHREEAPDKVEAKLLLTGDLGPGWHWGQNLLFEAETADEHEFEYGWTGGLSYTVIDQKLSVGAEAQFSLFDVQHNRGSYTHEAFIGPSVQWRPMPRMHLDLAPLIGIGSESPAAKILFVFGYEF
ncbi:MAG TPA: hypothetical protein VHD56_01185 [Tepidisphaeraceae bacterium]|nr:hypothetical protein [Tepidisphaeraceae bacterium]